MNPIAKRFGNAAFMVGSVVVIEHFSPNTLVHKQASAQETQLTAIEKLSLPKVPSNTEFG